MANQVTILNGYNITPPFSGIACDVYGNQCQYVGSGNTFPVTFILPLQFNTAPAIQLTLIDSTGCQISEVVTCNTNPTPAVTPTLTPTPTLTITPTVTSTITPTITPTFTETPTSTPTPTITESPTQTPTQTPTNTPTETITQTPTNTPTETPTQTPTNTPTPSVSPTPGSSLTPTPTITDTPTPTPTITDTPTPTPTPTITDTPTPTPTITTTPTETPTKTPTETPTNTPTPTPTITDTPTPTPTPTVTITESPTPTPTPTVTITESPTPTPTPTPSGTMLNNYFATQCAGTGIAIVDPTLLTGTTGSTFLGSDGNCWYTVPTTTGATATVTPLLEFGNYSGGTSCDECADYGCVNWEVADDGSGSIIEFTPCCGETRTSPALIGIDETITVCSKTQPIVTSGSATIVNQGICPTCP